MMSNTTQTTYNTSWIHPFTAIISGSSGAGKTSFVEQILKNQDFLIHPKPLNCVWGYGSWQEGYEKWRNTITFVEGIPNISEIPRNSLVILDDLMAETDSSVTQLFTKLSHHHNISVIYIVQNLFGKNKEMRTISLNSHYIVLFKNPRDVSQIVTLGRQMYPNKSKYFHQAYNDATKKPHGYLLVDLKQTTPDVLRLRTNIFPHESPEVVYVEK